MYVYFLNTPVLSKCDRTPVVADFTRFKAIESKELDWVCCYRLCATHTWAEKLIVGSRGGRCPNASQPATVWQI